MDEGRARHLATSNLDSPAISPNARTALYMVCLAVNVLTLLGFGLAEIFGLLDGETTGKATTLILGVLNIVSTGTAVGYRPTRSGATL